MDDTTLGERLGSIRRRRGLTQQELASRSGVSYSLIRQIERGERETTRLETVRKLAVPLGVQTSVLLSGGDADEAFADTVADWAPVTGALFAAPDDEDDTGLSASAVRATIGELRPMLEACRYAEATALLPALLRDARALTGGSEARQARCSAFLLAGSLLVQTRQWDAAEAALRMAADAAASRLDEATTVGILTWMWVRQGRVAEARELATRWADDIEPKLSKATNKELAVWGRMLLRVANAAVVDNRPDEGDEALDLAAVAAARIGREIHADVTTLDVFGPASVLMLRAETAVLVGQPVRALELTHQLGSEHTFLPLSGSRSRHRLDVANALAQLRRYPQALTVLEGLRRDTPQWLLQQRYARDVMSRIISRRRVLTEDMRDLADFLRVPY
jgi:transcriptional regulator with XRE-family HTH domain